MKVSELLTDESKWTRGAYCRDKVGNPILTTLQDGTPNPEGVMFCLIGAVYHCYGSTTKEAFEISEKISNEIKKITNDKNANITLYNDTRTFAEVKALVDKLDI